LIVNISVDQPLISARDQNHTNAAYITLEGLYSPPEAWVAGASTFVYTAALPIPINEDVSHSIHNLLFILTFFTEREHYCIYKWYPSCSFGCHK
jgi:hypothetical protein